MVVPSPNEVTRLLVDWCNGNQATLDEDDDWHLWKVSIDGGEPARLTDFRACYPSTSPDGKLIACVGRTEPKRELSMLILPFEGGQPVKRIEFSGGKLFRDSHKVDAGRQSSDLCGRTRRVDRHYQTTFGGRPA